MLGVVLEQNLANRVVKHGIEHAVILNAPADDVIRLTPPLVISDEEIAQAARRLAAAIAEASEEVSQ